MLSGDWGDLLDFIRVIIVNLRAQLPSKLGARGQKIFLLLLSSYFCYTMEDWSVSVNEQEKVAEQVWLRTINLPFLFSSSFAHVLSSKLH